jgi:hypothetical protein
MAFSQVAFREVRDEDLLLVHDFPEINATRNGSQHASHRRSSEELFHLVEHGIDRGRAVVVVPRRILVGEEAMDDGILDLF